MQQNKEHMLYADCADHDFDLAVLDHVNEAMGLSLRFSYPDYKDFPDSEPGMCLDDEDIPRIPGNHVIFFSCPIDYELEAQLEYMTGCLKHDYGAKSVTVVLRFLRYRRQENENKPYELKMLKQFLRNLKFACGVDRIIVVLPHNIPRTRKYCNKIGLELYVCNPVPALAESVSELVETCGIENILVCAPDFGDVGRAMLFAKALNTSVIARPKNRLTGDTVEIGDSFDEEEFLNQIKEAYGNTAPISCSIEKVTGKHVILFDDEVATGSTSVKNAQALRKAGAQGVHLVVTHPVCTSGWKNVLIPRNGGRKIFDSIRFGNARPRGKGIRPYKQKTGGKVETIDLSPIVAKVLIDVMLQIRTQDNQA